MPLRNKLVMNLAVSVVTIALVVGGAAPANAASPGLNPDNHGQTIRKTAVNDSCLTQLRAARSRDGATTSTKLCTSTLVAQTSDARLVTSKDLVNAKASLSDSDYASLTAAMTRSTIWAKSYSQTISQITDQERQFGTFYYNGSRVWVTHAYLGLDGTHYCVVDYAIGYGIDNEACSDSGSTTQRNLTMVWKVSLIVSGGPISWSEYYTLHVNRFGSIWQ